MSSKKLSYYERVTNIAAIAMKKISSIQKQRVLRLPFLMVVLVRRQIRSSQEQVGVRGGKKVNHHHYHQTTIHSRVMCAVVGVGVGVEVEAKVLIKENKVKVDLFHHHRLHRLINVIVEITR